ncbi:MAG TPA: hypothetical protein VF498_16575, partial [Anaerolineales bacterium]
MASSTTAGTASLGRKIRTTSAGPGVALDDRPVETVVGTALDPEPLVVTGRALVAARAEAVVRGLAAAALLGGARRL